MFEQHKKALRDFKTNASKVYMMSVFITCYSIFECLPGLNASIKPCSQIWFSCPKCIQTLFAPE